MIELYIYINNVWEKVEILNDINIQTTYQIFQVDELFKKSGDYTLSFIIKGSKINNKIFKHAFNISSFDSFKFNSPTPVRIYKNGVEILIGQLELLQITKVNKDIEYECVAYSNIRSLTNTLGDQYLIGNTNDGQYEGQGYLQGEYTGLTSINDLDYRQYNTGLTVALISGSWTGGTPYVFPLIDDGSFVYQTGISFKANHFTPALYIKDIFDKIIYGAGFTYTSNFLNSDMFSKLIMTSCVGQFKPNEFTYEKFRTEANALKAGYVVIPGTSGTTNPTTDFTEYNIDTIDWIFTPEMYAASGASVNFAYQYEGKSIPFYTVKTQSNTVTLETSTNGYKYSKFTVAKTGKYQLKVNVKIDNIYLYSNEWPSGGDIASLRWAKNPQATLLQFRVVRYNSYGIAQQTIYLNSEANPPYPNQHVYDPVDFAQYGDIESKIKSSRTLFEYDSADDAIPLKETNFSTHDPISVSCRAGDYFLVDVLLSQAAYYMAENEGMPFWMLSILFGIPMPLGYMWDVTYKLKLNITDTIFELSLPEVNTGDILSEGDIIDFNSCLPTKTKKIDFIKSIFSMFNLYVLDNPDLPNDLIIEPRDKIQSSGKIVDWSQKLDNDKEITIERVSDILEKKLNFTYKNDVDDISKNYLNNYNVGYGGYERLEKYYSTGDGKEEKTELIFGPPTIVTHNITTNGSIYLNVLEHKNIEYDNTQIPPTSKVIYGNVYKPRILFYNGISPIKGTLGKEIFTIKSDFGDVSFDQWPDFNHIDATTSKESNDLCFYYNYHYYQTLSAKTITSGNLFNKYYSKIIAEYEDEDAKKVTAYFFLNESDRYMLNLFDIIQVSHPNETTLHYRISKIENFDGVDSTKCELIKYNDLNLYNSPTLLINNIRPLNNGNSLSGLSYLLNNTNSSITYLSNVSSGLTNTTSANTYNINNLQTSVSSNTYKIDNIYYLTAITYQPTTKTYSFTENLNSDILYCTTINYSAITFAGGGIYDKGTPGPITGATKIGFFGVTPVVKPTSLTGSMGTVVSGSSGGSLEYTWLPVSSGVGFASDDHFYTMTQVVYNTQLRINELESKLKNLGLIT